MLQSIFYFSLFLCLLFRFVCCSVFCALSTIILYCLILVLVCRINVLINAAAYRPIGRYRRSTKKINKVLKTSGRYGPATTNPTVNRNFFCANNALFATGNVHTAKWRATGRQWFPVLLNADSGRWADTLFIYTHRKDCNIPLQYFFTTCRGQSIMFGGGLEPRAWQAQEREPITGSGGKAPWRWKPFSFWVRNGSSKFASFCPNLNLT